jgi:hypothetical protein
MTVGVGFESGKLGFAIESVWGTPVARTDVILYNSCSLAKTIEKKNSEQINGLYNLDDDSYAGAIGVAGDIECELRYEGFEKLIENIFPVTTSAETASFVITAANKYIDFKEDAGGALVATVAESTYVIGTSDAVSGSLCEAIKTALEATGSGTYSVTYSTTTKLVTIAVSGAVSTVQFLWKTGTHGSDNADDHIGTTLGFDDTADSADAASDVGDNTIDAVYLHTFKLGTNALPSGIGLTLENLISPTLTTGKSMLYEGAKINSFAMNLEPADDLRVTFGIIAEDETVQDTETVSALSYIVSPLVLSSQFVALYEGGSACLKNFTLEINNNLSTDRVCIGSNLIKEPLPTSRREVSGSITLEFENKDAYNNFVDNDMVSLVLTATGSVIQGEEAYKFIITLSKLQLNGTTPQPQDTGIINVDIPFLAMGQDANNLEATIQIQNTVVDV